MPTAESLPAGLSLVQPKAGGGRQTISNGNAVARGMSLFLGSFILSGLVARLRTGGFDPNLWWIDLRALPAAVVTPFLALVGMVLLAFAMRPKAGRIRLTVTQTMLGVTTLATLVNSAVVFRLFLSGGVRAGIPVPASLLFATAFAFIAYHVGQRSPARTKQPMLIVTTLLCIGLFPLVQVVCFGRTDYRRPADTAVVFGARVYADGRLSDAVGDRVRTAAQLYREGLVSELVMSGGPGDGTIHETVAMWAAAVEAGVPASAIRLDPAGLSTADTVRNTAASFARRRVLAVSEYYHLPRIKLAYARGGVEVFTIPAEPRDWRRRFDLRSVFREVPAFWLYYVRALAG